jgi:hypothetical protein
MEIDPTLDDIELLARRMVRAHRKAKSEHHLRDNGRSFFTGSLRIKTTGYLCRDRPDLASRSPAERISIVRAFLTAPA